MSVSQEQLFVQEHLFLFAQCSTRTRSFESFLIDLALKAQDENWGVEKDGKKLPILFSYITYTFQKLAEDFNKASYQDKHNYIAMNENYACFNTGLFDKYYTPIYCVFTKHKHPDSSKPWFLLGFYNENQRVMVDNFAIFPHRAQFFQDARDLIYDYRLTIYPNLEHIFGDERNRQRLPEELKGFEPDALVDQFVGKIEKTKKRLAANYKLAVPHYYPAEKCMQLLIPITLTPNSSEIELALALERQQGLNRYIGRTCLTLEMAYNNARLIVKPEVDWLHPN